MCRKETRWIDEIQVLRIKFLEKGTLKAVIDIQLGPLTIRGLRVVESGDRLWTAWPQDSFPTPEGFRRFVDIVQPTKDVSDAVTEAIKAKWATVGRLSSTDKSFN